MEFKPHDYQTWLVGRIVASDSVGVFIDLGMGKTVISLTAVKQLLETGKARRVLVAAPARVAESVWAQEAQKWDHTRSLSMQVLTGLPAHREKMLENLGDITVISRDLLVWLVRYLAGKRIMWPFDTLIVDELSGFKDSSTMRFKALKVVMPYVKRVIGLTGTPMPKDVGDLWGQAYLLDRGKRLGRTVTEFRKRYMRQNVWTNAWTERPELRQEVIDKVSDICVSLRAADYLSMPPLVVSDIPVILDESSLRTYRELKRRYVTELAGQEITAVNAAVLANKLLQLCNGAIYSDDVTAESCPGANAASSVDTVALAGELGAVTPGCSDTGRKYVTLHNRKMEALLETLESIQGHNALVYYQFRHDLARIKLALKIHMPKLRVGVIRDAQDVVQWNQRRYDVMLAQPQSVGMGLNLQDGGRHIVWFGLPWSLQVYQQATGRLWRQGQTGPVMVHRLIVEGGLDERVARVLDDKAAGQDGLLDAIRGVVSGE